MPLSPLCPLCSDTHTFLVGASFRSICSVFVFTSAFFYYKMAAVPSSSWLLLPCPPTINDAEGQHILANVGKRFTDICPPPLRVLQVRPLLGKYKNFKCAWLVEYGYNKDLQIPTNKQTKRMFEVYRNPGTVTLLKKMEPVSDTWVLHYGLANCICPPGLIVKNKYYEVNKIDCLLLVLDIKLED